MATLMNVSIQFQVKDNSGLADATKYRRLVGKFIYLTQLRPDITYIVGVLSRYMSKPTNLHFGACKRYSDTLLEPLILESITKRGEKLSLKVFQTVIGEVAKRTKKVFQVVCSIWILVL